MELNIEKELFDMQDKKYQEFQKKLCPGTESIIGIRIPKFDKLLTLLDDLNYPLQVTSANLSNQSPLTSYEDVLATFSNQPLVTCIVEGQCVSSIPTTIISLVDGIKLIRQGELPFDKLVKDFQQS